MKLDSPDEDAYLRLLGEVIDLARISTLEELHLARSYLRAIQEARSSEEKEKAP